jgi:hypothetical protein
MNINRSAVTWGTVFVLFGAAFLLDDLGVWTVQLAYLLPALLIFAGLALTATAVTGDQRR